MSKTRLLFFIWLFILTACGGNTATPTATTSAWGTVITLGQAEQMDAPSIWPFADQITAAWIGADETGIHQDIRTLGKTGLSERVVLPLPPKNPYAQQMFPAGNNNVQILWLDADTDGVLRLYAALITPALKVERGPTVITEQNTRRYTAIPNGDGSVWAISSGGLTIEPRLYANLIDAEGRPLFNENDQIVIDADWPTLARANDGTIYLFWIRSSDSVIMRGIFANGVLQNPVPISENMALDPGDRLVSFRAGLDMRKGYLFWNVSRKDGRPETWFSSGGLDEIAWAAPQRFGLTKTTGNFETGFNSGTANAALAGDTPLSWVMPLAGQFDTLPVAAVNANKLGIVYLQNGLLSGYQDIVDIKKLIGMPALLTDRDRFLYLAWSEPNASGKADLNLTTTRGF